MNEAIQVVIEIYKGGDHSPAETSGHIADSAVTAATSKPPKQRPEAASAQVIIPSFPLRASPPLCLSLRSHFLRLSSLHDLRRLFPVSLTYTAAGGNITPLHCVLVFGFLARALRDFDPPPCFGSILRFLVAVGLPGDCRQLKDEVIEPSTGALFYLDKDTRG